MIKRWNQCLNLKKRNIGRREAHNIKIAEAPVEGIANGKRPLRDSSDGEIVHDGSSSTNTNQQDQKRTELQLTFLENSPSDVDIFLASSFEPITDVLDNSKSSPINVNPSGFISWFDDIPPDDDFQTPSDVTKRLTISYDDFSETIVPQQLPISNSPSNYTFNEEPPPGTDSSLPNISNNFENKRGTTIQATSENVLKPIELKKI